MHSARPLAGVDLRTRGEVTHVTLAGRPELDAGSELRGLLHEVLEAGPLVLDLSAVEHVDPAGVGVLVGLLRRAERRGHGLTVVLPQGAAGRELERNGVADALAAGVRDGRPGRRSAGPAPSSVFGDAAYGS